MIDCGSNLERQSLLLKGVRLRDTSGIDSRIELGLLPNLGTEGFRSDLIIDPENLDDAPNYGIEAVLPGHGHMDHCGSLFALSPSIELHTHSVTAAYLLASFITTQGTQSETTHIYEREAHPSEDGLVIKPRGAEAQPRRIGLVDRVPSKELKEMFRKAGSDEGLFRSPLTAAGMDFEAWDVDHSLFGAVAFCAHTSAGSIAHLTDLRMAGANRERTERAIRRCEKIGLRAAFVDGTCLGREDRPSYSEANCRNKILEAVRDAGRRVVIASYSEKHLERMAAVLLAAHETKRRLVVSPKSMLLLEAVGAADTTLDFTGLEGLAIYDRPLVNRSAWLQDLRERHHDKLVSPSEVAKAPHKFIVSHEAVDRGDWFLIKPHNGIYIHANSAAYDDEGRARHRSLEEWLAFFKLRPVGIDFSPKAVSYDPEFNPSGHLSKEHLVEMVNRIHCETLIPIHTSRPELFRDFLPKGTKLVIPEQNKPIWIS
jgi:ribonuclease J